MVDPDTAASVDASGIHPLVRRGTLNRQVVVSPDTVLQQSRLPRAVGVVLQRRQGDPVVVHHLPARIRPDECE